MELWGGLECTINRVQNSYFDQLDYSGHYLRKEDLNLFADLGIKKIRYPVLWEKHQPEKDAETDWTFCEQNLEALRNLGIEPIAGLVHHGSGPAYVNMAEESFAEGLAEYAAKVASKFPWLTYYTPVNEPLTTARFCGLYGHWYPHLHDDRSFIKILINECKATIMAMQAIRKINPGAKLVQTEDLGKIHSTPLLKYQADFENNRRWLSVDLLCGQVDEKHALWDYLVKKAGVAPCDLHYFTENPCQPDILGFNHYVTSERYLDERLEYYPEHTHGGNQKHRYADVEAVRVAGASMAGPYGLLKEAWDRYKLPLAITEVHLHCTREEQLRWFKSVWQTALTLRTDGVDLRAVTTWAMLGSFGWNKLLTQPGGDYEPGIFDIRSGSPRKTALCRLITALSQQKSFDHPVLEGEGWWQTDKRLIYTHDLQRKLNPPAIQSCRPLLIIGKTGTLGKAFARLCEVRNIHHLLLGRPDFDITDITRMELAIRELKPWAIINAAGYVKVDEAETDAENCFLGNSEGPKNIAALAARYGIKFMTFSSDLVFDGTKNDIYTESDTCNPLNIYGKSKAEAEGHVLRNDPNALIIRTSAFFGPWDQYNFVYHVCNSLKDHSPFRAVDDIIISPTYVPDLVNVSLDLLIDDERGIWHLSNKGVLSWYDLAREIALITRHNPSLIEPVSSAAMEFKAPRPKYSAIRSERGYLLPGLEDALQRFIKERKLSA